MEQPSRTFSIAIDYFNDDRDSKTIKKPRRATCSLRSKFEFDIDNVLFLAFSSERERSSATSYMRNNQLSVDRHRGHGLGVVVHLGLHRREEKNFLDVVLVRKKHREAVDTQAPAPGWW